MITLLYDGTFEGFLSTIFDIYEQKHADVRIRKQQLGDRGLWGETNIIETHFEKSNRVWEGIKKYTSDEAARHFYCSYLSEIENEEDSMLQYLNYVFSAKKDISTDFTNPSVLRMAKVAKKVGREKHRMEAFVRFQLGANDVWYATIEPDFNVLPLISKHFKSRYADQKWLILDKKRGYGLFYDLENVHILSEKDIVNTQPLHEKELSYQNLWKTYFKSTNIVERVNMKLHKQHVPLRYWKYLSEKQV
jgi:probable DNA metabolism protein